MGGNLDWNVPVIGGEQMYQAMKNLGRETELVIYPDEYHEFKTPVPYKGPVGASARLVRALRQRRRNTRYATRAWFANRRIATLACGEACSRLQFGKNHCSRV